MKKISLLLVMTLLTTTILPNNIQIANASLTGQMAANQTVQVQFDLSWDNAWRTSTSVPLNWDAAWVFVKYRVGTGNWHHARISPTGSAGPATCTIDVASDSTGAFIYMSDDGYGSVAFDSLELSWAYGANGLGGDEQVEIKVFAIEMVYIPAGPYYLGDGLNESGRGQFNTANSNTPFQVTSEDSIPCGSGAGQLYSNIYFVNYNGIPATYPKGFNAFYCMKYEISQEQYMEFLNTLTREQQNFNTQTDISGTSVVNVFVMSNLSYPSYQNGIKCSSTLPASGPVEFFMDEDNDGIPNEANDGQTKVGNFIDWLRLAAYLDWAGLRPMTELEYEKVCRGTKNPVEGEYVWGTTSIHSSAYTIVNNYTVSEYISNPGTYEGNVEYWDTRGSNNVFRCGIFAASAVNPSRQETGAGYYGCMELSGSVYDEIVEAGDPGGRSFTGLHGNGELNDAGNADTDYWPGMGGNSSSAYPNPAYDPDTGIGVTSNAGIGIVGGSFFTTDTLDMRTSDRFRRGFTPSTFGSYHGGRGCRTAN